MLCTRCGGATSVTETRAYSDHVTSRRRLCKVCGYRFFTCEVDEAAFATFAITREAIYQAATELGPRKVVLASPRRYTKI